MEQELQCRQFVVKLPEAPELIFASFAYKSDADNYIYDLNISRRMMGQKMAYIEPMIVEYKYKIEIEND